MNNFLRLSMWAVFLSLAACNQLPVKTNQSPIIKTSLWQVQDGGSIKVNDSPTFFADTRIFLTEKSKDVCLVYNSYLGGKLSGSTLYQGTISRGKVEVFEKRTLYGSGGRAWTNVEPIEILVGTNYLAIRFEDSTNPDNANLQILKKLNLPILQYNIDEVAAAPEVNVITECENLLQIKISDIQ